MNVKPALAPIIDFCLCCEKALLNDQVLGCVDTVLVQSMESGVADYHRVN